MLELETHLEGVFAVNLGQVVSDLEGGADFIRRQEGVAAQSLQTLDSEGRQTAVFVLLRNARDAKLSGQIAQIVGCWRNSRGVKVVQACPRNVNHGRREYMRPSQGALLRQSSLRTFLETTAIGHAPEDAGNELRIVHVAEAVENLVLVAEVEVHPGVKSVAIFADRRRSSEVGR